MANNVNLPMLVAQHGDKAGFLLASVLTLVFVVLMIAGPAAGDMSLRDFQQNVAVLDSQLADDSLTATHPPSRSYEHLRNQLPARLPETARPSLLPRRIVQAPRPNVELRFQFEGQKGRPAFDLQVVEAINREIQLRWRPSRHSDTSHYHIQVWELDDEGWSAPPAARSVVREGTGLHVRAQVNNPDDDDAWVTYQVTGVQDNHRYGILVSSVDADDHRASRVSYEGNPEGRETEDNYDSQLGNVYVPDTPTRHGYSELAGRGLYVEAIPAGQRLSVPLPIAPQVDSQSLGGVRLSWEWPEPNSGYVDLDDLHVQIWRWVGEEQEELRLLTPQSGQRPLGWNRHQFQVQQGRAVHTDVEVEPGKAYRYAIRFYHVGVAYPPLTRTGLAVSEPVSLSDQRSPGGEIRQTAYAGDVITIDYPHRDRRGAFSQDPDTGLPRMLRDETYVYASRMVEFDMSPLDAGLVLLENRPLIEVIESSPRTDVQLGRVPQFGRGVIRLMMYFEVAHPQTGNLVWERFGAEFDLESGNHPVREIGDVVRPQFAGPRNEPIEHYQGGVWAGMDPLDFREGHNLLVVGFYRIRYHLEYTMEYIEFWNDDPDQWQWPFKIYPQSVLLRYPELQRFQAENDWGRTQDQMLEVYSRYMDEIEYPARRRVAAARNASHFVHRDMIRAAREWMFEWVHEPRMAWQESRGEQAQAEPPMWQFAREHGLRFFPRSYLGAESRRDSLDPEIRPDDPTTWHNEVRRLNEWAQRELAARWAELEATLAEEGLTEEVRDFVETPGFDTVALPALVEFIRNHLDNEVVLELTRLVIQTLQRTHGVSLEGVSTAGLNAVREHIDRIANVVNDVYTPGN